MAMHVVVHCMLLWRKSEENHAHTRCRCRQRQWHAELIVVVCMCITIIISLKTGGVKSVPQMNKKLVDPKTLANRIGYLCVYLCRTALNTCVRFVSFVCVFFDWRIKNGSRNEIWGEWMILTVCSMHICHAIPFHWQKDQGQSNH